MDALERYLNRVAYKFDKGYPDVNNPKDIEMLMEMINPLIEAEEKKEEALNVQTVKDLLDTLNGDQEALKYIKKYIQNRPGQDSFFDYATSSNVTDKTVDTANAPQVVFKILADNDDFQNFLKYKESLKGFGSLGQEGNLLNKFADSGLSKETLKQILSFSGKEGGRGVGKGEVGLSILLDDVKMAAGKGDLDWGGKYLEVKGTAARLGKRDRSYTNFDSSELGKIAVETEVSDRRLDTMIPTLIANGADEKEVRDAYIKFLDTTHPKGKAKDFLKDTDLTDSNEVRRDTTKTYFTNYAESEGVDHFIFMNTSSRFGDYVSFTPEEISPLVDSGKIAAKTFSTNNLDPSLLRP